MKKAWMLYATALGLLILGACSGDDGDTGPAGPPGTANVIYSEWAQFTTAWRDTSVDGSALTYNDMFAPGLSQEIIDSGTVLGFIRFGNVVCPLPYTSYAGGNTSTMSFILAEQHIYFTRFTHDNSNDIDVGGVYFRYILIPGGVLDEAPKDRWTGGLEDLSYEEICDRFGISP
jgi:hypothetical protein